MAIQSPGEFQIIMTTIIMRINQRLDTDTNNRLLVMAKKTMEEGTQWAVKRKKPNEKELKAFADAEESVRQAFRSDTALSDQLFDLLDFLEYGL